MASKERFDLTVNHKQPDTNKVMPEKSLANKNLVIIGGTTGLGLSAAKAFIESGANVIVVGRNEESAAEAKKLLGNNAEAIVGDAVLPSTAHHSIEVCISRFGSIVKARYGDLAGAVGAACFAREAVNNK